MDYYNLLTHTTSVSVLAPFAAGVISLKKRSLLARLLFLYIIMLVIVEAAGAYTAEKGQNNLWMSHMYVPLEFVLLSLIYFYTFTNRKLKKGILAAMACFVVASVLDALFVEEITTMNTYPRVLASTLLTAWALAYLYTIFQDRVVVPVHQNAMFILSAGIIVYFAGSVILFSMFNDFVSASAEVIRIFMVFYLCLIIFFNMALAVVMLRSPKT